MSKKIVYKCSNCGLKGHKLWRQYSVCASAVDLMCAVCAETTENEKMKPSESDQCGGLVPAIPTVEMDTYWGYTSTPDERCLWWHGLPTFKDKDREIAWLRAYNAKWQKQLQYYMNKEYERIMGTSNA